MASIRKRGTTWRVELYRDGVRESATFPTKARAAAWALEREAELTGERLPDKTLGDALVRYARDVAPLHKGAKWEKTRCTLIGRHPIARKRVAALKASDLAGWRDDRLQEVSGSSVAREMNILRSVLEVARKEWGWIHINPIRDVKKPASPPSRRRRIDPTEVDRLCLAMGYMGGAPETPSHRVALAFLLALETAMRAGEITGLHWSDVGINSVRLPLTKNGDAREVPLSKRAREIIGLLPRHDGPVFDLLPAQRDVLFRRARDHAEVENLRFHDSRAEAIWRLSKKLDVMELARMIGHRDLRSLMFYYASTADELAAKLDAIPASPAPLPPSSGSRQPRALGIQASKRSAR